MFHIIFLKIWFRVFHKYTYHQASQFMMASMHCLASIFKLVWVDRKRDTTVTVSLDTRIEQFLAGQRSSDNTCKLRSRNRAREQDVPKAPFSIQHGPTPWASCCLLMRQWYEPAFVKDVILTVPIVKHDLCLEELF